MSKAFLPTILEQKEKEVAQLVMEDLQPLRQTYRLYDFLKSNQNKLQIISEVKKASPSMGDINLMWILWLRPRPMRKMAQP